MSSVALANNAAVVAAKTKIQKTFLSTKSNLKLWTVENYKQSCEFSNNPSIDFECAICYKSISKTFFQCNEPCNKLFHTHCVEQMMEQAEEAAYEEDKDAHHRCCYCRRDTDMNNYFLQLLARRLLTMRTGGYDVSEALNQVVDQIQDGINENEDGSSDDSYNIYEIRDIAHMKKPKQSKRTAFKKNNAARQMSKPRISVKRNIGGRRR
jgi:hypothetical protein